MMAERKTFGHRSYRVATPPVLEPAEHDLDAVTPFVAALVVFDGFLSLLPARDAGAYALVFQRISEPIGIIAAIPEQPLNPRQAAQQGRRADVIADLSGGDEETERAPVAVADCVQLGVHAALGAANQATAPPFLTPRLDAVRWALR